MTPWINQCGWGSGLVDSSPPIRGQHESGRRCRELALRQSLEVLSDAELLAGMNPLFGLSADETIHARLVRLLLLLNRLVNEELPALRRRLRCQSVITSHWSPAPHGGRVNFVSTARAAVAAGYHEVPQQWLVERTTHLADTSVNRLAAAILHRVLSFIEACCRHSDGHWQLRARESHILRRARTALRKSLELTPLGMVPESLRLPIGQLHIQAERRRAEFVRIRSLVDWWQDFTQYDLSVLQMAGSDDTFAPISDHGVYELVSATALLLALRDRLTLCPPQSDQRELRFQAPFGNLSVVLGTELSPYSLGRPPTILLVVQPQDQAPRRWVVEVRNSQGTAARETASRLILWQMATADTNVACLLLTPLGDTSGKSSSLTWKPFIASACDGIAVDAVAEWHSILEDLLRPIEKGK